MSIKATVVGYAFLVQYFENATIVAYVGLRVTIEIVTGTNYLGLPLEVYEMTMVYKVVHNCSYSFNTI